MVLVKHDEILILLAKINSELAPSLYECIEAEWEPYTGTLRLYIETKGQDQKIVHEDCAKVNQLLEKCAWLETDFPKLSQLEISSPGIERPLRSPGDFERHIGKLILVNLVEKIENRGQGKGILTHVDKQSEITLNIDKKDWKFPLQLMKKARVVYNWEDA